VILRAVALGALVLAATSCGRAEARRSPRGSPDSLSAQRSALSADSLARARQDSINRAQPGYIVDSILPLEEELRRFRAVIPTVPVGLTGGAPSRDGLVELVVGAIASSDTASLVRLALTRAEFAYLVYPSSPYTKPPYRQPPWLVWMHIQHGSGSGLGRVLHRYGGRPLGYASYGCDATPERQGANRLWKNCALHLTSKWGDMVSIRLFGVVIERHGRFKIVGYGNDL